MKKVFFLLVLVSAASAAFYYSVSGGKAENQSIGGMAFFRAWTQTPEINCTVQTGIDTGLVNLRACPGMDCGVLSVLSEGQTLQVIGSGHWPQVRTETNLTGYVNSKYCKGK